MKTLLVILMTLGISACSKISDVFDDLKDKIDPPKQDQPGETKPPVVVLDPNMVAADFGYYAIQMGRWNCQASYDAAMKHPAVSLSYLHNSFCYDSSGKRTACDMSCIKKFTENPKTVELEVHLINTVCQRNKNCSKDEVLYGYTVDQYKKAIDSRDKKLETKLTSYFAQAAAQIVPLCNRPGLRCRYSVGLEDNISGTQYQWINHLAHTYFPGFEYVWNPLNGGAMDGFVYEKHGGNPSLTPSSKTIANLDGTDIDLQIRHFSGSNKVTESQFKAYRQKYAKNGGRAHVWVGEFNCRKPGGAWSPINERTNCPSPELLNYLSDLMKDTGTGGGTPTPPVVIPPVGEPSAALKTKCGKITSLGSGVLWKPESNDTNDNREGKPVIIFGKIDQGKNPLSIFDINGGEIGKLGYYGIYQKAPSSRYYTGYTKGSNDTAPQLLAKASKTGHSNVYVKAGSGCYGPIVPTERTGSL